MPGYIIHLIEADLIINLLKKGRCLPKENVEQWMALFRCGNLIPDAVSRDQKQYSHFWQAPDNDDILKVPNLSMFLKQYKLRLEKPALCGYYAHLHLDWAFYTDYFRKHVTFYNKKGMSENKKENIFYGKILQTGEHVDIHRLFSEEYIYGDYTRLNHDFINEYHLHIPWTAKMDNLEIDEAKGYDLEKIWADLHEILKYGEDEGKETKVFSRTDLDMFLNEKAHEIAKILEGCNS